MSKNLKACLLILVLTLLIMGVERIYQEGAIFLLDYVFYPVENLSVFFWRNTLFHFVFEWGMWLFGHALFSKIFFFLTIFASGRLGYRLTQNIIKLFDLSAQYETPLLICGILLLLINPVLYERMITQPGVYAAMVLLWYGLLYLLKTITTSKLSCFARAGLFFGLSVSFSAHMVFFAGLVSFLYLVFFLKNKKIWLGFCILALMTIFPNLNWLIWGFIGSGSVVTNTIATFNQANIEAFLSNALSPLSLELTNLTLRGFRGERYRHFILPGDSNPLRWIFSLLLLISSIAGYVLHFAQHRQKVLYLSLMALFARIFGCGISSSRFWSLNQWIYDHIPFYIGLREPQKWIGLLLFPRAIGIILLMSQLLSLLDELRPEVNTRIKQGIVVVILVLFLIGNTPILLNGFSGQLQLTDYPTTYQDYKVSHLSGDIQKGKILIFPWHSYIRCPWTKRIISNPMKAYLGGYPELITSDNIEVNGLYTNSISEQSKDIEKFLQTKNLSLLKQHNISTILMMQECGDFHNYDYLVGMTGLQKVFSGSELSSYSIK